MASPRGSWWHRVLGAVTGVGGLFWGRDLPYWGGGEEERARGEGASPHVISLEGQVSPSRSIVTIPRWDWLLALRVSVGERL